MRATSPGGSTLVDASSGHAGAARISEDAGLAPLRTARPVPGGPELQPIDPDTVQRELDRRQGRPTYVHLETTTGSYTKLGPEKRDPVIAFVRNARVTYERGSVTGTGPYRVGLKLDGGWVYAQGLTDFEVNERDELLLAGLDGDGNLTVALQLSTTPFREA